MRKVRQQTDSGIEKFKTRDFYLFNIKIKWRQNQVKLDTLMKQDERSSKM